MVRRMRRTLPAPYLLVAALHLLAQAAGRDVLAATTQVLLMPALALVLLGSAQPRTRITRLTAGALLFSWLGDSVPRLLDGDAAFGAMLGCFLVAQVFFIRAFLPYAGRSVLRTRRAWLTPYVVALLVLLLVCAPAAGVLAPAVVVYGVCLAATGATATGVNALTWAGGAVFMVSDSLIALDAFEVWTQPGHDVWVMATYCVAQLLLVLGVLRQSAAEAGEAAGHHPTVVPAG
jgi:uncharacterized membrane protein YhhN